MAEDWQSGHWLLLDAAGPRIGYGLLANGRWSACITSDEPFTSGSRQSIDKVLEQSGLSLEEITGVLYAAGPGSTLGLRLAAMFIRTLLRLPGLEQCKCAHYNNLELSAASLLGANVKAPLDAVAPWRRDRVHRVRVLQTSPFEWVSDYLHPDDLDPHQAHLFILGNRPRNLPPVESVHDYPIKRIPELLARFPDLLSWQRDPQPFSAEAPDFARWSSKRHTAQ